MKAEKYLEQGKIICTHGVHGECKLEVWCGDMSYFAPIKNIYLTNDGTNSLRIRSKRQAGKNYIAAFEGIDTVEAASPYKGKIFYIDRAELNIPAGRFLICDMIGLPVKDITSGCIYGTLDRIDEYPASDIYIVKTAKGEAQVPDVPQFIRKITSEAIYISPIEGMFE